MLFKPWFNLQFKALLSLRFMVSPIKDTACWIPPSTPFQEEDILIRSLATCTQLTEEERLQLGSSQFVSAAAAIAKSESGCLSIREAFLGFPSPHSWFARICQSRKGSNSSSRRAKVGDFFRTLDAMPFLFPLPPSETPIGLGAPVSALLGTAGEQGRRDKTDTGFPLLARFR